VNIFLLPYASTVVVLLLGCIALLVVVTTARHWKYVLRDSLLNTALLIGFALLINWRAVATVLAFVPGVLASVIAISSWVHSDLLANLERPPRYITLYPTRRRSLIVLGFAVVAIVHMVMNWREQAYVRTSKLLDVAAIEAIAHRSQNASRHLEALKARSEAPLQGYDLIEACGSVIRLAELDGVRAELPHPTSTICRSASTYSTPSLRQSN
jgi:hypothetical protein